MGQRTETATFAAGCFWGVEHAFRSTAGVIDARSGYIGGDVDHPTYEQVCADRTGHAEAVQITFDADRVSFEDLLEQFWGLHDPTQLNRQGWDVGRQYRSAIFTHDQGQARAAQASKDALDASGRFAKPVVTEIVAATTFWDAEDYHQRYFEKQGVDPHG